MAKAKYDFLKDCYDNQFGIETAMKMAATSMPQLTLTECQIYYMERDSH